ncbi:MAG: orotate phosphoribosyltransferase [Fimbriimonadaceae bacterium]|nr:orotate phosphoribosyltransferase [Fimbriimonadaceae bacterium]
MTEHDLLPLLEKRGAILRGHFILTSGRHSDLYVEKFRVLEQPDILSEVCARIASFFKGAGITLVAGPTTGGIIIAFEVARQLGVEALYVESENGVRKLRRGAKVPQGSRVLVVDDVLTTGKSIQETISALGTTGQVVGVGVLIDRSEKKVFPELPFFAACRVEAISFAEEEVPSWLAALPVVKPGTRA